MTMYTPDELLRHGCEDPELLRQALAATLDERGVAIKQARNLASGLEEIIGAVDRAEDETGEGIDGAMDRLASKAGDIHYRIETHEPPDWFTLNQWT